MSGLCDSTTGLANGSSLQWQTPIGGAGLTNTSTALPATAMAAEDGIVMVTEDSQIMVTE